MLPIVVFLEAVDTAEDKSKFADLFIEYKNLIYWISYEILHNVDLAEDCVQEVFFKIIDILDDIDNIESLKTKNLIARITSNHAKNIYNKRKRDSKKIIDIEEMEHIPDTSSVESVMDEHDLKEIILMMPDKYREILELIIVYGRDYKAITKILHISEVAARKRYERAKAMLVKILRSKGEFINDL